MPLTCRCCAHVNTKKRKKEGERGHTPPRLLLATAFGFQQFVGCISGISPGSKNCALGGDSYRYIVGALGCGRGYLMSLLTLSKSEAYWHMLVTKLVKCLSGMNKACDVVYSTHACWGGCSSSSSSPDPVGWRGFACKVLCSACLCCMHSSITFTKSEVKHLKRSAKAPRTIFSSRLLRAKPTAKLLLLSQELRTLSSQHRLHAPLR